MTRSVVSPAHKLLLIAAGTVFAAGLGSAAFADEGADQETTVAAAEAPVDETSTADESPAEAPAEDDAERSPLTTAPATESSPSTTAAPAAPSTTEAPAPAPTTTAAPRTTTTQAPRTTTTQAPAPTTTQPAPKATTTTTQPAPTTTTTQPAPAPVVPSSALYSVDFQQWKNGLYEQHQMNEDFDTPRWNQGVKDGRTSIVSEGANKALRVEFPEGTVGPKTNGASFVLDFNESYDELYVRYRVKFSKDFAFRNGGKLPGLFGGARHTGGNSSDGTGFSARMMWRPGGAATYYLYHVDQPGKFGDSYWWHDGINSSPGNAQKEGDFDFIPEQWHTIEQRVKMNDLGKANGVIEGWLDGEHAIKITGLRLRTTDFGIDGFYYNNFFGGQSDDYRPVKDEHMLFDDLVISTTRVGV